MTNVIDISDRYKRHEERRVLTACTYVARYVQANGCSLSAMAGDQVYTPSELDRACDIERRNAHMNDYAMMLEYFERMRHNLPPSAMPLYALMKQEFDDKEGFELLTRGS